MNDPDFPLEQKDCYDFQPLTNLTNSSIIDAAVVLDTCLQKKLN